MNRFCATVLTVKKPVRTTLAARVLLFCAILSLSGCSVLPKEAVPAAKAGQAPAIVFDIDGTLTTKPISVFTTRDKAVVAVRELADRGYQIIYLSARHPYFQWLIPSWLEKNGFPDGPLHVPQSRTEHNNPASFKSAVLQEYVDNGWTLKAAFGDTSTDFEAYLEVGIPRQRIYALQRIGADACQSSEKLWNRCMVGWGEQMQDILSDLASGELPLPGSQ